MVVLCCLRDVPGNKGKSMRPMRIRIATALGVAAAVASASCSAVGPLRPEAASSPSGVGSAVAAGVVEKEALVVAGAVRTPDSLPAASVEVLAYLVSNNSAALTAGAPLAAMPGAYRIQASASPRARTDSNGRFSLLLPATGSYNIEAVDRAVGLKAWQGGVLVAARGSSRDLPDLQLAPTGTLAGHVTVAQASNISNLEGVDVFVPGSSYLAKCDAQGRFTLADVAAGVFDLVAAKAGLGRGQVKNVQARSRETVMVPDIALETNPPRVTAFEPQVAPVGGEVAVIGAAFGASEGLPFAVTVGGFDVSRARRLSDDRLLIVIPRGIESSDVQVEVGGLRSEPRYLPVFDLPGNDLALADLTLLEQATVSLATFGLLGRQLAVPDLPYSWVSRGEAVGISGSVAKARGAGRALVSMDASPLGATQSILVLPELPVVETLTGGSYLGHKDGTFKEALFRDIWGLAVAPDGAVIVADTGNHCIRKVDIASGSVTTLAGTPEDFGFADGPGAQAKFYSPKDVAVSADGTIYVADYFNSCIRKISADGAVSTLAGKGIAGGYESGFRDGKGDQARFAGPMSVHLLRDGALLVAEKLNSALRRIERDGSVTTLLGDGVEGGRDGSVGTARLSRPRDAIELADGSIWIADAGGSRLRVIRDGKVRTIASLGHSLELPLAVGREAVRHRDLAGIQSMAAGPDLGVLAVDDRNLVGILWPDGTANLLAGGRLGYSDGVGRDAQFYAPNAIAVLPGGDLVVADANDGALRRVRMPARFTGAR